jgi:hypothetical protein
MSRGQRRLLFWRSWPTEFMYPRAMRERWCIHLFSVTSGKYLHRQTSQHRVWHAGSWDYWHGMGLLYHLSWRQEAVSDLWLSCSEFGCSIFFFVASFILCKSVAKIIKRFFRPRMQQLRLRIGRDGHGYGLGYEAVNPDPYPENPNPNPRAYGSITGLG